MKYLLLTGSLMLLLLAGTASAAPPLCGFESAAAGSDASMVCPNIHITTPNGNPTVVQAGNSTAVAYGAPNGSLQNPGPPGTSNNCLEDALGFRYDAIANEPMDDIAKGFSDIAARVGRLPQNITFEFINNVTVSSFSVKMFDFGDYNPENATSHTVTVQAYDALNNPVGVPDVLFFNSSTATNPGNPGGLWLSGDACTADPGDPGYYTFTVNHPGIAKVVLTTTAGGQDPNVAFDSVNYTRDNGCTLGYWKNHLDEWANTSYMTDDLLKDVFVIPGGLINGDPTLLDALKFKGGPKETGGARILLRQAVAALLNATDPNVGYSLNELQIIQMVNDALASDDRATMIALAEQLDAYNNLNCTVN